MVKCPACGEENPPKFRLCGYCGAPLGSGGRSAARARGPQDRDAGLYRPQGFHRAGRAAGQRGAARSQGALLRGDGREIKRHGGKIEKYIGDAIMAVFGLPRAHEDDALRAVRAAVGMRDKLNELNAALEKRFGVTLAARTGVNTGEVVALDDPTADQKLATGDAVNVTARLEAAAPANEIYIGEVTYRLVRDAVEVGGSRTADAEGQVAAGFGVPDHQRARACTATSEGSTRRSSAAMQNSPRCGRRGMPLFPPAARNWSPSSPTPASASRGLSAS